MKVKAEQVLAGQLKEGDLFSAYGPEYWENAPPDDGVVGERVYIRTGNDCPLDQANEVVYRLTIEQPFINDADKLSAAVTALIELQRAAADVETWGQQNYDAITSPEFRALTNALNTLALLRGLPR